MAEFGRRVNLSPTKVDTFFGCQRLFYYRYINPPYRPPETKPLYLGNVAHAVLQKFHEDIDTYMGSQGELMGECFRDVFDRYHAKEKLERGFITRQDLHDVRIMLKRYLHKYYKLQKTHNTFMLEKLINFKIGGVPVSLKADRIEKTGDHEFRVIDYKTSQTPPTDAEQLASVQVQSYGIMIRSLYDPKASVFGEYLYLRHLGRKAGVKSYEIDQKMMDAAAKKYQQVYDTISNGCKYFPNRKYKYCGLCDFKRVCVRDAQKLIEET